MKILFLHYDDTHFSGDLSITRSAVRKAEGSGDDGWGLCEVLRGEELRSDVKDTPCLRISWTALSLRVRDGWKSQLNSRMILPNVLIYCTCALDTPECLTARSALWSVASSARPFLPGDETIFRAAEKPL